MRLELLSGDTIEVFSVTVEIPINPNVLTEDMREQLNKSTKLAILKPDTNITIKNNIVIVNSSRTIGYITHINEKSVFAELHDAHYLKNLYDLFIEPILIDVSKDDVFVIFECYINKDDDKTTKELKNVKIPINDFSAKYNRVKDSKEAFKDTSTYNTVSGVLTAQHGSCIYTTSELSNDQLWNKAGTDKPITKQDVNIKSGASTNGLETLSEV